MLAHLTLARRPLLYAVLIGLSLVGRDVSATGPYRMLSPSGKFAHPAVLLLPGCSGFATTNGVNGYDERAADLQTAGYIVVFVDYIGRRMQNNCAHISQAEVVRDILEAAAWTRDQPGVDASRLSVIGWSYGGGGVLAALRSMPPSLIAKAVLYYPVCRGAGPWPPGVVGLLLLGGKDDIAVPALCDAVIKGVPSDRLQVITYPNARHGFDMRGLPERADVPSGSPGYSAETDKSAWATVREFLR